jgi:hypothetical protein
MSNFKLTVPAADATLTARPFMTVEAGNRLEGTCHFCNRAGFKLNAKGRLSRHGFTRPQGWGSEIGECPGSSRLPEETLNMVLDALHADKGNVERLLATDLRACALRHLRGEGREASRQLGRRSYGQKEAKFLKKNDWHQPAKRAEAAKLIRDLRANTVIEGEGFGAYNAYRGALEFTPTKLRARFERQLEVVKAELRRANEVVANAQAAGAEVVRFVPRPQLIKRS